MIPHCPRGGHRDKPMEKVVIKNWRGEIKYWTCPVDGCTQTVRYLGQDLEDEDAEAKPERTDAN